MCLKKYDRNAYVSKNFKNKRSFLSMFHICSYFVLQKSAVQIFALIKLNNTIALFFEQSSINLLKSAMLMPFWPNHMALLTQIKVLTLSTMKSFIFYWLNPTNIALIIIKKVLLLWICMWFLYGFICNCIKNWNKR